MKIFVLTFLLLFAACHLAPKQQTPAESFADTISRCPSFIDLPLEGSAVPILSTLGPLAERDLPEMRAGLAIYEHRIASQQTPDGKAVHAVLDAIYKVDILLGLVFDRSGEKRMWPSYIRDTEKYPIPRKGVCWPVEEGDDGMLRVLCRYGGYEGVPNIRPSFLAQFDRCVSLYPRRRLPLHIGWNDDLKKPNQALLPTPMADTSAACAPAAPATVAADL